MSFEGVSRVLQGRFQYFASLYFASKNFYFLFISGKSQLFNNLIETGFKYASREIFNVFQGCLRVL